MDPVGSALALAKHYFDLSNRGDLDAIAALMTEQTTYSSQNTGLYLGAEQIMAMQRQFFSRFTALHWAINSAAEIKSGIVEIDFTLTGLSGDGTPIQKNGIEYIIVFNGKLQHVDVRNR